MELLIIILLVAVIVLHVLAPSRENCNRTFASTSPTHSNFVEFEDELYFCTPTVNIIYKYDKGTGEWTKLDLPEESAPLKDD